MHDLGSFASSLAVYLIFCREGSVVAHLWMVMSVPISHVGTVTVEKVSKSLQKGLKRYAGSDKQMGSHSDYILHLPSLSVTGESKTAQHVSPCSRKCFLFHFSSLLLPTETHSKVIELLKASLGITPHIHCLCRLF